MLILRKRNPLALCGADPFILEKIFLANYLLANYLLWSIPVLYPGGQLPSSFLFLILSNFFLPFSKNGLWQYLLLSQATKTKHIAHKKGSFYSF